MLNMNCALILLPVCRNFMSWLRSEGVLPLDDHVWLHKLVAVGILAGAAIHIVCHYVDYAVSYKAGGPSVEHAALGTVAGTYWLLLSLCRRPSTETQWG